MSDFVLQVNGEEAVSARLSGLVRALKDTRVPNRALATQFYGWVIRNYDGEGSAVGGWAPLAPSTVKRKARLGKEKLGVVTGHLRASLVPFSDASQAGVGSNVPYAAYFDEGTERQPARRVLPTLEEATEMAVQVYGYYVAKATAEANR